MSPDQGIAIGHVLREGHDPEKCRACLERRVDRILDEMADARLRLREVALKIAALPVETPRDRDDWTCRCGQRLGDPDAAEKHKPWCKAEYLPRSATQGEQRT